ncbi:MAG TPA: CCA tRNA nucleotidyltransferase [Gemmataceae bacterium]|nr:CCA tRNA nucleotidyltransferase [Gemmataceae bacterium]
MTEREFAINVVQRLQESGFQALWAGGCVRDELLGLTPKDYDVATSAKPDEVRRLFRRSIAVGAAFGVVEVLGPRDNTEPLTVEVATFRSDVSYSDGRHPDQVIFSSPREDAQRRDFTINGMFFDPLKSELVDYVNGQADLAARVLRAIGEAALRFEEDKLRMLRAVRIAARFQLEIEPATRAAIERMANQINVVSAERIAAEIRQIAVHPHRVMGMNLLHDLGLAAAVLPEIVLMKGLPQGPPQAPTGDLWDHVMRVLDLLGPEPSFPLAFAALLHDVGKPRTASRSPERYTFYFHEHVGRRIADDICLRLKLSNAERERITWLVEKHQILADARTMRTSTLKPLLAHEGIGELLDLHRADALASAHSTDHVEYCEYLLKEWSQEELDPPPLLTGHDLTRHGLTPGPQYKIVLDAVREAQLDGSINSAKQALEMVDKLVAGG